VFLLYPHHAPTAPSHKRDTGMNTNKIGMTRAEVLAKLRMEREDALYNEENAPEPMAEWNRAQRHAYERAIELVSKMEGVA
jgi:hypothetical protein